MKKILKKVQSRNSLGQFVRAKKVVGAKVQCLVTTKKQDKILKPILKQMSKAK